MGLLQECILCGRLQADVNRSLCHGQSGYMRGTEDAQLVVTSLCADAVDSGRCVYMLKGDFDKAFPSVWREDLVVIMAEGPKIGWGMFAPSWQHLRM